VCDGYALRLDARTGNRLGPALQPREASVWEAGFNRNDNYFLTLAGDAYGEAGFMQVWDAHTGQPVASPTGDRLVLPAADFHPDGRLIATGAWEGKAQLWDAKSGTRVGPVLREPAPVHALAFSSDGRTLALGARGGTLTLWPIPTALPGDAEQIQVWLESLTGQELDESGAAHELAPREREERRKHVRKLGGAPSESSL
jgi:WD40 repeat protein